MVNVSVSVIIPCYNALNTIERAIESIALQTCLPVEVIVVDDCSTDNKDTIRLLYSLKIKFESFFDIIIVELDSNLGAASARNRAWDMATQDYIAFLDADDVWHKNKLEVQYHIMKNNPDIIMTSHKYLRINDLNEFNKSEMKSYNYSYVDKYKFLLKNSFPTPTLMMRRKIPYRYHAGKRYSEDYLLSLQIIFANKVALIDADLAGRFKDNYGESGLSSRMWDMEKGELETYKILYKSGVIGLLTILIVSFFSLMKYFIRMCKLNYKFIFGETNEEV